MSTAIPLDTHSLLKLLMKVTSAYVSNNRVPAADLPDLLKTIHGTITSLTLETTVAGDSHDIATKKKKPSAAAVKRSIQPHGLVSFLNGQTYKILKRHLASHGHNPESYRVQFGLPADYPMVAKEYRERRSAIATGIGLGRAAS